MDKKSITPEKEQRPDTLQEDKKQHDKKGDNQSKGLQEKDLPDASNKSTGATGSGQRQDSN